MDLQEPIWTELELRRKRQADIDAQADRIEGVLDFLREEDNEE